MPAIDRRLAELDHGWEAGRVLAVAAGAAVLFLRGRLAPDKRVRRIEFADLPKTISGKIRRVQLRTSELEPGRPRGAHEFWEDDVT